MPSTTRSSRSSRRSAICFEHNDSDGERRRITVDPSVEPGAPDGRGNRVETSKPDARSYDDPLPRLPIPGTGEADDGSGDRPACGEQAPLLFCPDCGEYTEVGSTCGRSRCPHCWESWAFHRVANNPNDADRKTGIGAKLEQLRLDRNQDTARGPFFHHVTVSFRPDVRFNSSDPLGKAFDAVKGLLQIVDVDTGYLIYHPWRIVDEHRGDVRGHESGDGDLTWKDILRNDGLIDEHGWEHVRDEFLSFEPHFHVLSCGYVDVTQTEWIERETGVVIHRITKESSPNVSLYDLEDLAAAGSYSVSHAGLEQRDSGTYRAAIRAFGEVANHKAGGYAAKKADTAMRAVAHDVLGVDFPKPTCNAEQAADCEHEHDHADETEPALEPEPDRDPATPPTAARAPRTRVPLVADGGERPGPDDWSLSGDSSSTPNADDLWNRATAIPDAPEEVVRTTFDAGGLDPEAETPPGETATCGATLRPMFCVDDYLSSTDWCETIPDGTLERLRDARDEWADLTKPKADAIAAPPDDSTDNPPDD